MSIDISFPPEVSEVRVLVRKFISTVVNSAEEQLRHQHSGAPEGDPNRERRSMALTIVKLRQQARDHHLWLPHMPQEWGGMGLGPTAVAAAIAEASRSSLGPYVLNCQSPDEDVHLALLHSASAEQKDRYLKPLCEGVARACIASIEPEPVPGQKALPPTTAVADGDDWVLNGHKWFVSGARGAQVAIITAAIAEKGEKSENRSAFIVDLPADGWQVVRDIETVSGAPNQSEVAISDLRVPGANILGQTGQGDLIAGARSSTTRLAECMKWISESETALELMIQRVPAGFGTAAGPSGPIRIAESAQELYQAKLMVLHAAYRMENRLSYETELAMARRFVAGCFERIIDRAMGLLGPLGYSTDTPLANMLRQFHADRVSDGPDEDYLYRLSDQVVSEYRSSGSARRATGDLPF
jgi:acyl-CoA dehydrogenase